MHSLSRSPRNGAILVVMVLMLPVILLLAAFAINLAYMELARTEIIIATDAAARAGGRELATTGDQVKSIAICRDLAASNVVAGKPLRLSAGDMVFGRSTRPGATTRYKFAAGGTPVNSLRVDAHRDKTALDGPVALLMPNFLGTKVFNPRQSAISTQVEVDVALVVDRSGSMAYASKEPANIDFPPYSAPLGWVFGDPAPPDSRWRDLVTSVAVFNQELKNSPSSELVSLSSYGDLALTNVSLTNNYSQLLTAMDVYTRSFQSGYTNIGAGINEGVGALMNSPAQRPGASKVLIVMTDGMHNVGVDPVAAAEAASAARITIFTITFAIEADQALMQRVASMGDGQHFHATNLTQLVTAFRRIAQTLPTLLTQ